ncbi:FAD:protein FMN transferase [Maribacter sp. 2307ULW6-5]|uniref:FAD:protein FMN transferase n=1 Tax=Maribacter sp. 2307ULW6-5 TaxID=3386275 RepID=UPI0039BC891B
MAQHIFKKTTGLMGSRFELTVVAQDSASAHGHLDRAIGEIARIERLISSWDPRSQTTAINQNAGVAPVTVAPELYALIARALEISKATDGAFDITYAAMDRLWTFDGTMRVMPSPQAVAASVVKVGYGKVVLHEAEGSVYLPEKGMKIGFGAIGKGYAADRAKKLLQEAGVRAGIINAGGDMQAWGKQPNGSDWQVAITNPMDKNKAFALLPIGDRAVVTSGNYEKFVRINGTRYVHIIDPRTGYPSTGILSVSVFAPKAELADALATAIFVMGKEVGLDRVNQLPGVECIIIDEAGQLATSKNIDIKTL